MKALSAMKMALALALGLDQALAATPVAGTSPGQRDFTGKADFSQHLNGELPGDLVFRDERGSAVRLRDYLGGGPLGLVFSYYGCSNLCPTQIRNLAQRLAQTSGAAAGNAQVLVVSIDPLDSPALADRAKHKFLDNLLSPERAERWHFLSGAPADIARLTESLGFRYAYDPATRQYAHPAGFALITAEGKIARYFFGFDFSAEELGRAFEQVDARRIGSPIQRLLLVCFHYDLAHGPYSTLIVEVLRVASLVMLLGTLATAFIVFGRARRARTAEP